MAFNGYWIKISGNSFITPPPSEYSNTKSTMDLSAERVASGLLHREIAPHEPYKVFLKFPPMKESNWATYFSILDYNYLTVEFWDKNTQIYRTATMYHNEIIPKELNIGTGEKYIDSIEFNLIEY